MMYTHSELLKMAEAAFRDAMLAVVKTAKQTGTPIVVWQDDCVIKIQSEQFDQLRGARLVDWPLNTENVLEAVDES